MKITISLLLVYFSCNSLQANENFPSLLFSSTKLQQNNKGETATSSLTLSILKDSSCYYNETLSMPGKKMSIKNKGPLILSEKLRKKIQLFFFDHKYKNISENSLIKTEFTGTWLSELSLEFKDFRKTIHISNNIPSLKELSAEGYELLELLHEVILFTENR